MFTRTLIVATSMAALSKTSTYARAKWVSLAHAVVTAAAP